MRLIRKATSRDLPAVNELLGEVLRVHHAIRPDLFKAEGKKYTDEELLRIFEDPGTPVFVLEEDGIVCAYLFCQLIRQGSGSLQDIKTLYIDDLCVASSCRGKGAAKALYEHAVAFARSNGCHNITLHVWEGNDGARAFYDAMGLKPQYVSMEAVLEEE